jgi:hypothetical protein
MLEVRSLGRLTGIGCPCSLPRMNRKTGVTPPNVYADTPALAVFLNQTIL